MVCQVRGLALLTELHRDQSEARVVQVKMNESCCSTVTPWGYKEGEGPEKHGVAECTGLVGHR